MPATLNTRTRIAPQLDADGRQVELNPPSGGSWLRDADGGLTPLDKHTAEGAGLAWGADLALQDVLEAAAEPNDPLANTAVDAAPSSPRKAGK